MDKNPGILSPNHGIIQTVVDATILCRVLNGALRHMSIRNSPSIRAYADAPKYVTARPVNKATKEFHRGGWELYLLLEGSVFISGTSIYIYTQCETAWLAGTHVSPAHTPAAIITRPSLDL